MDPTAEPAASELRNRNIQVLRLIYDSGIVRMYESFDLNRNVSIILKLQLYLVCGDMERVTSEVANQQVCVHPNIVKLYDYFWYYLHDHNHNPTTWIAASMTEVTEADLYQDINSHQYTQCMYSEEELFKLINEIVSALAAAQNLHICHHDIKPANIFMSNGVFKIGGFSLPHFQRYKLDPNPTLSGVSMFLSPVLIYALYTGDILEGAYNPYKSDVYSLGATVLSMMQMKLTDIWKNGKLQIAKSLSQIPYSDLLRSYLGWMLTENEADRPDFIEMQECLTRRTAEVSKNVFPVVCEHYQTDSEIKLVKAPCGNILCRNCINLMKQVSRRSMLVECQICKQTYEYPTQDESQIGGTVTEEDIQFLKEAKRQTANCLRCEQPKPRQSGLELDYPLLQGWVCSECLPSVLEELQHEQKRSFERVAAEKK